MFEQDEKMRQRLLNAAEKLNPNDSEIKRGKPQRAAVARELIRTINEETHVRVTRVTKIEQLQDRDEIPEMIEEAVEAGKELYQEMKDKRQSVVDDYDVEIDKSPDHGYIVKFDGREYSVTYPDEIVDVKTEDGWAAPNEVKIPENVGKFAADYWKAWDKTRSKMLDRMEEIGFHHLHTDEYFHTYRVGDFGPRIVVSGAFPLKVSRFNVKARREDWWDADQVWDCFEDSAKNTGEGENQ